MLWRERIDLQMFRSADCVHTRIQNWTIPGQMQIDIRAAIE